MTRSPAELTAERGNTHGDYGEMSKATMDIMRVCTTSPNWDTLPDTVQVFFFNLAQKAARILTGNPYEPDHYADIAGYAHLAGKAVAPPAPPEAALPMTESQKQAFLGTDRSNIFAVTEVPTSPTTAQGDAPTEFTSGQIGTLSVDNIRIGGSPMAPALVAAGLTAGLAAPGETAQTTTAVLDDSPRPVAGLESAETPSAVPSVSDSSAPSETESPTAPTAAATAPTDEPGDAGLAPLPAAPLTSDDLAPTGPLTKSDGTAPRAVAGGRSPARRFP